MQTAFMRGFIQLAGAMLLATSSSAAFAADEQPICAARPGKATAACTVPAGRVQLEIGLADWSVLNADRERDQAFAIGETVFKYGLTDRSDIEVDVTPWEGTTSRAGDVHDSASGFGDVVVSYKKQVSPRNSALQITILPFVKAPTASHDLGDGKWEAG